MKGGMTVPELARLVGRDRDWVRGACDAKGVARTRIGTADWVDPDGVKVIVAVDKQIRKRQLAHAS